MRAPSWQTLAKLVVILGLIVAANYVAGEIVVALRMDMRPSTEDLIHRIIMAAAVGYALLIAIPFVPGVEVGLAIIGVLGHQIVPLVYLCTVVGLTLGFLAGRLIPLDSMSTLMVELRLDRASRLLDRLSSMDREARLAFLTERAPSRLVPMLLRHRYIALAVAINLPGNFLIGGGGGIALAAGISGLYSLGGFVVTMLIAVAPIPLAILLLGENFVGR